MLGIEKYINYNGEMAEADSPVLFTTNRAFRYGDSIFESMRFTQTKIPFFDKHWNRLSKAMSTISIDKPENFTSEIIHKKCIELAEKNNILSDARIRLTIFRTGDGQYVPQNNSLEYTIEIEPMEDDGFVLPVKGLTVDIYSDIKKSKNSLSPFKTGSSLFYVMAGIYKTKNNLDDCILVNDKGNVIEGISSNIFAVKNGVLYTPPIEEACVDGVMRKVIIEIAKENKIAVYEIGLAFNVMLNADEAFFTDAVNGIRGIGAYKAQRSFNTTSKLLVEKLNLKAAEK
jgi:branched-subunit amino acid aminotransferase/4-amino-4-deoxychorismate lyase